MDPFWRSIPQTRVCVMIFPECLSRPRTAPIGTPPYQRIWPIGQGESPVSILGQQQQLLESLVLGSGSMSIPSSPWC